MLDQGELGGNDKKRHRRRESGEQKAGTPIRIAVTVVITQQELLAGVRARRGLQRLVDTREKCVRFIRNKVEEPRKVGFNLKPSGAHDHANAHRSGCNDGTFTI